MKSFKWLLLLLMFLTYRAHATAYIGTCTTLEVFVGEEVPPGIYTIATTAAPGVNLGAGAAIFSTPPPLCTPSYTVGAGIGSYTQTMNAGVLANPGTDTISYVNGNINVIASTSINSGAVMNDSLVYPSWFGQAGAYPVLNVQNNGICNLVPDGVTDNRSCLIELFAMMRGGNNAQVSCDGTDGNITLISGTQFTGIGAGLPIYVNGTLYHTGTVTDASHMTITDTSGNPVICPLVGPTSKIARLPP